MGPPPIASDVHVAWSACLCVSVVQQEAQLSQRDRATCCVAVSKFVLGLCFMRYKKASISKSDPQGHSRALALVPVDRPHTISY